VTTKARCGARHRIGSTVALTCDKDQGHDGPHRGYYEAIDSPMFWRPDPICPTCGRPWVRPSIDTTPPVGLPSAPATEVSSDATDE
jgi:hypothetical protein